MKILITSALPYANGELHFGHIAGAYLPGDCYARSQRLLGHEVLYICGSDEHGVAITLSADKAGRTPKEQVDYFHPRIVSFFNRLNFSFDHYSRTTSPGHVPVVQSFYKELLDKGHIEERTEMHLYSEKDQRFLADRYVVGICPCCGHDPARGDECPKCGNTYEATELKNPRALLSNAPLTLKPSNHLYLRFDHFKEDLKKWLESKNWKENVVRFAMRYVEDLRPRAITRDSSWGVPVPDMKDKVFYVWFDAPIGYVSATKEWAESKGTPDLWKDYWLDPSTKLVQFIGKDNIPFHAVFFPAMLMGQSLPFKLPDEIPANEFYLLEGKQFSKSDGWTIDTDRFFSHFSADQIRYSIAANAPENADSEFSWKDFQMRCNAELGNKLGNFVQRVLKFTASKLGGVVPPTHVLNEFDESFNSKLNALIGQMQECYTSFHLRKACQTLMEICHLGNAYFDSKKPWTITEVKDLETTLALCLNCVKLIALTSSPLIPNASQKIWEMLGMNSPISDGDWKQIQTTFLPLGQHLEKNPSPLFPKVEDELILNEQAQLAKPKIIKKAEIPSTPIKSVISFEEFQKVDLRVAEIITAQAVPKSKKLLQLSISLGLETRTVVSGIAQQYKPDDLVGKKVLFLANLAPAKLMGIESQGMVLAGSNGEILEIPGFDKLPSGTVIS
jgi:methionyl-tRNA synthetase